MSGTRRPQDAWKPTARGTTPADRRREKQSGNIRRWFGIAVLLAALCGTAIGLIYYLFRPNPEPYLLAIAVTKSPADWPPNPWAEADAGGLRERFPDDSALAFQSQDKARILSLLTQAAEDSKGKNRRRPLVVYLCALGVSHGGKVYLVPADGTPDDPGTWLSLEAVLDPLRKTDARRLLVLDLRPARSPRGLLPAEDVNEALESALAKLTENHDLPYFVLSANTPADGPTVIRPLRRTAFGLALAHGLGGAADGWGQDKDDSVSVGELAAYTRELTYHATKADPRRVQLPRLHGQAEDFRIRTVPSVRNAALPAVEPAEAYPEWLRKGWQERDGWVRGGLAMRNPRLNYHFSGLAFRAEQRWLAGVDQKGLVEEYQPTAERLLKEKTAPRLQPIVQPVYSVARVRRAANTDEKLKAAIDSPPTSLQDVFTKVRAPDPDPKDVAALIKDAHKKPLEGSQVDTTAAAIFQAALDLRAPNQTQIRYLANLAAGFKPQLLHVELHSLDLIAGLLPSRVKRWPSGTIGLFLQVAARAEEVVAVDGRCFPMIRGRLESGDENRRKAIRALCSELNDAVEDGPRLLKAALEDYKEAADLARALESAWKEYEETRAVLADLAVWYPDVLTADAKDASASWDQLVETYRELEARLQSPAQRKLEPNSVELAQDLREHAQRLRAYRFNILPKYSRIREGATQRELELALRWPEWTAEERASLVARLEKASGDAWKRVLDQWPVQSSGQELPIPVRTSAQVAADTLRELRRLSAVLLLVDGPEAREIEHKLKGLGPTPNPTAVEALAMQVRAAWRKKLPAAYRTADPGRQARIGWAVDPEDEPAAPQPGVSAGDRPNPESPARRRAEREFHQWLARDRYRRDAADVEDLWRPTTADYAKRLGLIAEQCQNWIP